MDLELLNKAIDNEKNVKLLHLNILKIEKYKINSLKYLSLNEQIIDEYMKKLKNYIFVDSIDKINLGSYFRWIMLNDKKKELNTGSILLEIKITNNNIILIFKSFFNKKFSIMFDEGIFFQKLNPQEVVLLSAIDYLKS